MALVFSAQFILPSKMSTSEIFKGKYPEDFENYCLNNVVVNKKCDIVCFTNTRRISPPGLLQRKAVEKNLQYILLFPQVYIFSFEIT